MKHVSGWDVCADGHGLIAPAQQRQASKNKQSTSTKMLATAATASAVMLATSLSSKAEDLEDNEGNEAETKLQPDTLSPAVASSEVELASLMNIDNVLGSVKIASATVFNASQEAIVQASAFPTVDSLLPRDFITKPVGVSDPAQPTNAYESNSPGSNIERATSNVPLGTAAGNEEDSQSGQDGSNGIDGTNGKDGVSILILDPSDYQNFDIAAFLAEQNISFTLTGDDNIIITLTPDQAVSVAAQLTELLNATDEEETNHNNFTITGTEEDDYIVATERGGTILGLGGNDILVGNVSEDHLIGGDGNDTADYSNSSEGINANLDTGTGIGGDAEGDQYTSIENLVGSNSNDTLTGNALNNILFGDEGVDDIFGGNGFDRIEGGEGGDLIDGGDGATDIAEYLHSDAAVSISLLNDTASGGHAEGDELNNIESLSGSLFDDFLQGNNSDNRLGGLFGEDTIYGEGGDDTLLGGNLGDYLDGGDGNDTADYTASLEAVEVNLAEDTARFGEAEGDTLVSIENLAGSAFDDTLTGDENDNRLTGRDGDDTLIGNEGNDRLVGGLGADHHDGGDGNQDAADYSAATEAVGVDLINNGFAGEAFGDTYSEIEFVVGSEYHDSIFGDNSANRLDGLDGCDILHGRDGNDTLIGGLDNDVLNGGSGNDVFIFEGVTDDDTIEDFEAGLGRTDRVWLRNEDFETFEEIQGALTQTDDGALLTHSTGEILFQNIEVADLVSDDFILA